MLTPDVQTGLINQFQGSMQASDAYNIDPGHGLYDLNCDFLLGPGNGTTGTMAVQVGTRRGVAQVNQTPASTGAVTSMANWFNSYLGTQQSFIGMYAPSVGVLFYNTAGLPFSNVIIAVTAGAIAVFAFDGLRAYVAICDSTGRKGISQGWVFGLLSGNIPLSNPAVDALFASPLPLSVASVTPSATTSGVITAGTHNIAYVFVTRNGDAAEVLNPVTSGGVFLPVPFVAADGVHNLSVAIVFASIPSYLSPSGAPLTPYLQLAMTSAANPNEYYLIPGAVGNVPATPGTVTITASITDGDLTTGTNVTQNQNILTAINGSGPFNPSSIFPYSSRLGYVTLDSAGQPVIYFSDQNNYQFLTAAFHGVYLENRQIPVHGCSLGGVCYIATLAALYAAQDNGGQPVTWTPPTRVDGSVGILSPTCMIATGGKILLASEKGLFIYRGGAFPQIPLSYWQAPDWNRINWLAPTQVQIVDDSYDRVIRVQAPLSVVITGASNTNPVQITTAILINNAPVAYPHLFQTGLSVTISGVGGNTNANGTRIITVTGPNSFTIPVAGNGAYTSGGTAVPNSPNAQMCWAYPAGDTPGQTFYSIHAFTSFRSSSMAIVRNINTNVDETWFGPSADSPGCLVRRVLPTDANPYRDVNLAGTATAINSLYETSLVPGTQDQYVTLHDIHGMHMRMSGNGNLNLTAYSLDHNPLLTVIPLASPIALAKTPGREILVRWFLRNEQQSISFGTNAVDAYFIAALLRVYYSESLPLR